MDNAVVEEPEVNRLVLEIITRHSVESVVKSKSKVSEEIGLNEALNMAQAEPHNVVYIDDRALFVDVAISLGIRGIVHTGYEVTKAVRTEREFVLEEFGEAIVTL